MSFDLVKFFEEKTAEMNATMKRKNHDYGGDQDPFKNFTMVEALEICQPETGFLTRMTDKLSRITTFVNKGNLKVKNESVQDTLLDLANYALLMSAYLESQRKAET